MSYLHVLQHYVTNSADQPSKLLELIAHAQKGEGRGAMNTVNNFNDNNSVNTMHAL